MTVVTLVFSDAFRLFNILAKVLNLLRKNGTMSVFLIVKGRHFLFVRVQSHAFTLVLCHNGKKRFTEEK